MTRAIVLTVVCVLCALIATLAVGGYISSRQPHHGVDRSTEVFKDCPDCPEMLVIQPGRVAISYNSRVREEWFARLGLFQRPKHIVTIGTAFAAGRHELTFEQWDRCVAEGGCNGYRPPDEGWGRGSLPVIHVSWNDAQAYVRRLSAKTGATYRLLTEAGWEYAARAGTTTRYYWGRLPTHDAANYGREDCCHGHVEGRDQWVNTSPAGSFPPNAFGLHDMSGNVYEWVQDCDGEGNRLPLDGSALILDPCERHRIRGGAWYSDPERISPSYRAWQVPDQGDYVIGFRVARTL